MINNMKWNNFKDNPPCDVFADYQDGLEADFTYAWFMYKRPNKYRENIFISRGPCKFYNGLFEGYENRMGTPLHPEDLIEIVAWTERYEVEEIIIKDYKNTLTT